MPPKKNPKFPCGTCNKSANTNALLCNFCDMWHHATTDCIPWHTKETIDALMTICKEQSCWSCQKCIGIMKKLNGRIAKLEKDVGAVKDDVKTLQEHQIDTDNDIIQLRKDLKEVKNSAATKADSEQTDILSEMKDREDRKCNIIIHGMIEPTATEKEEVHRMENDSLRSIFQEMQTDTEQALNAIKFKSRLGAKQPGKHRPFLVKFHDRRVQQQVMQKTMNAPEGIRIKPDLTKKQREEDDKFKRSLDEENQSEPKDDSGDFRWKLAGPPGNLRKVKTRDIQEWEEAQQRRTRRVEAAE